MSEKTPVLSVIMPVYNTAPFLKRGIESVLNQTFADFELILVNDGSTDESLSICREYEKKDNRVLVIDKPNEGAGPTRNKGIEVARGKYVVFPDSDDWLEPVTYEACVGEMEEKGADLLIFNKISEICNGDDELVSEQQLKKDAPTLDCKDQTACRKAWAGLFKYCSMNAPWNKIYRRAILSEYNLRFPAQRRMQDGLFNVEYFDKIHSLIVRNDYFYHFRVHSIGFQRKKMPPDLLQCAINYHHRAITLLESWGIRETGDYRFFDDWFVDTVYSIEQSLLPAAAETLSDYYRHVKKVNNNPYVHAFFKKKKKSGQKLSKRELAILHRWNLLLAIDTYRRRGL